MNIHQRPSIWRPSFRDNIEPPYNAREVAAWKRRVYNEFDIYSFERKVAEFWKNDLSSDSFDIVEAVDMVLRDRPRGPLLIPYNWDEIPVGTRLWRARQLDGVAGHSLEVTGQDLWEPPAHVASAGRMNKAGESLLYTCIGLPIATLTEARIAEPNSHFILIGYEVTHSLIVKRIGLVHDPSLTRRQQKIERLVSEFLSQVVSVSAESIGSKTYEHTQKILRRFYLLEPDWESGWIYWSTLADLENEDWALEPLNLAIEPLDARARLEVRNVVSGTHFGVRDGKHHIELHGFSNNATHSKQSLEFEVFPHGEFSSMQDYFDYLP